MRDGILYVDATAHYSSLEGWGIHLFNYMARRLRSALIDLEMWDPSRPLRDDQVPVGPEFVYDSASAIFEGRSGQGPLFIAWDTNLLLDYFNFGSSLWQGRDLPDELGAEYTGELEGLQFLVAFHVCSDAPVQAGRTRYSRHFGSRGCGTAPHGANIDTHWSRPLRSKALSHGCKGIGIWSGAMRNL